MLGADAQALVAAASSEPRSSGRVARAADSIGVIGTVGTWTSRAPSQRHLIARRMWS
jgi:hypothetical protein